jgi:hypothetical protein
MNPSGTYLELKWESEKLVTSGDATLDESARTFVDYVVQYFGTTYTERISELERENASLLECASVLELLVGSIDAAQFEGLHEAIASEDAERMKDLLTRRILHHEHDAHAAVTTYLDTIQETLVPNIKKAYNVDFNNARNSVDVDALLEEVNYLRFLVKLEKKATWEYSRV